MIARKTTHNNKITGLSLNDEDFNEQDQRKATNFKTSPNRKSTLEKKASSTIIGILNSQQDEFTEGDDNEIRKTHSNVIKKKPSNSN